MNKYLLWISLIIGSSSAFAGGGGSAWMPSVSPGQCISFTGTGDVGGYKWSNTTSCNEVIDRNYAQGVLVSGRVIYDGGQSSFGYSGVVGPGRDYTISAPTHYNGKKSTGLADTYTQWLK
jgi:hypothetical protein